jgi:hypothetical protein
MSFLSMENLLYKVHGFYGIGYVQKPIRTLLSSQSKGFSKPFNQLVVKYLGMALFVRLSVRPSV